jgi:hypothetical protein
MPPATPTTPLPYEIAAVLGALFFLLAGWNQLQRFMDRHREKPIPADTYRTMNECKVLHVGVDQRIEDLKKFAAEIPVQLREDRRDMYHRIVEVEKGLASVQATLDTLGQRLSLMDPKLDRLLERGSPKPFSES